MTHPLDHITSKLAQNPYQARVHNCVSIDEPALPAAKVYRVFPEGGRRGSIIDLDPVLEILEPVYQIDPEDPSHLGVVSLNGSQLDDMFVTTMNWDIRGQYPSVGEITVGKYNHRQHQIDFLPTSEPCLYDASLFGWEAAKWFQFLQSARTGKDLEQYLNDKYTGPLPIPR
ncbi:hypothetical protein HYV86_00990 [Candidatus Woesearchaeota archaeon]|nr:hypothetical protein [Candidatus Woesearchaeota archaeon]